MRTLLALLAFGLAVASAAAAATLELRYALLRNGQEVGEIVERYRQDGDRYRVESITRASGVFALLTREAITLVSEGRVEKSGLVPQHFEHHRGSDARRRIAADFDWTRMEARFRYDGKEERATLVPGLQDRLSAMYQFRFLPLDAPLIELAITNGRGISRYVYERAGEEVLATPLGPTAVVKLVRRGALSDARVTLWIARDTRLVARMVIEESGGSVNEQRLLALVAR